ncbi:putative cysteinyl-tRNA synthetase [Paramicrosporidium saccamoebae]|uniref:cysteine--tRNA ligase n=1 Tax=Paramicrosporidium saccamoebae TaxID=1246581 RepID=A0A2H9THT8_9FUNG|nr:putative cysteinyl-tRNA synthetase [Paramicrosporidium saccamoebae]
MSQSSENHPYASQWKQPEEKRPELVVYNSLTRTKVPFRPAEGNSVRWYNCGPTVYDASHIGHARNYVTFDIIRRILEDYFNYDVTLVMNITDIDDKIILRARQAHLVAEHRKENPVVTEKLLGELKEALGGFLQSKLGISEDGWVVLEQQLGVPSESSEESDAKKRMHFKTAQKGRLALNDTKVGDESSNLLDSFQDIMAVVLDGKFGASVTDQKIFRDLAAYWEDEYLKDMAALNVRPASLMTRVTEFVPQVIDCIQEIIKNGYAYEAQGSVYFDVGGFGGGEKGHLYAKLCPWSAGNCKFFEEGEGALGMKLAGKKDPRDFALWKASKEGEPVWDSPWGSGRPGWHIECSAMAAAVVPGVLDIHSGGIDLAFPHHDNELAQAEAYYECSQWVNYFMHAGHVHIEGHKMSKSLKNFITIRESLERYTSSQLRIMFLQHQWHAPVFYRESSMTTAIAVESLFFNFFNNIAAHLRAAQSAPPCSVERGERDLIDLLTEVRNKVHIALCDNFDTPAVLGQLQELVNRTNIYIQSQPTPNAYVLRMVGKFVKKMLKTFGVIAESGDDFAIEASGTGSQDVWETVGPILEIVSEYRDQIRSTVLEKKDCNELLNLSDTVRNKLTDLGVIFEDRPGKSTLVKLVNKETVAKMKADQDAREVEKLARKLEMARINEAKKAEKLAKAAIVPSELFKNNAEYSKFDDQGVPTHDATGEELSKNARKKAVKEYETQVELHQKYLDGKI